MLQGQLQQKARKGLPGLGVGGQGPGKGQDVFGQAARFGAQGLCLGLGQFLEGPRFALALGIPVHIATFRVVLRLGQQGRMLRPQFLEQNGSDLGVAVCGENSLAGQSPHLAAQADGNPHAHGLPPMAG